MTWHPPRAGSRPRGGWHWRTGLQLSLGEGHQVGREEAQLEREGSCRHAKAAFGFNICQQKSVRGLGGVWVTTGSSQDQNHIFGGPWRRSPRDLILQGTFLSPAPGRRGSSLPHSQSSLPPQPYISPPPGSQASILGPKRSPADPSSGQEKCSARLCTLICAGL